MSFRDPHFLAPADISGSEARAWEEKIAELVRNALIPSDGPVLFVQSVMLCGEQPDTELRISYSDARDCTTRHVRYWLWKDPDLVWADKVDSPASLASAVLSHWSAGTLEPIESDAAVPD